MESKSGALYEYSKALLGPKWRKRWIHFHECILRCYPATDKQLSTMGTMKPTRVIDLRGYEVILCDENTLKIKLNKKFAFQLQEKKSESKKRIIFACTTARECHEWVRTMKNALTAKRNEAVGKSIESLLYEEAKNAFELYDSNRLGIMAVSKLPALLQSSGWKGNLEDLSSVQKELDPDMKGIIQCSRFIEWWKEINASRSSSTRENSHSSSSGGQYSENEKQAVCSTATSDSLSSLFNEYSSFHLPSDPSQCSRDLLLLSNLRTSEDTNDYIRKNMCIALAQHHLLQFVYSSLETIFKELWLPNRLRTIQECETKEESSDWDFLVTNLHFSFKWRHYTHKNANFYMITGAQKNAAEFASAYENTAVKGLNHEIRACRYMQALLQVSPTSNIRFTYRNVIDFHGYRFYISIPPSKQTVKYLSFDAEKSSDPDVSRNLENLLKHANLWLFDQDEKISSMQMKLKLSCPETLGIAKTPVDNSQYVFLCGLAHAFPPDLPLSSEDYCSKKLRPEFVEQWEAPIWSNAYRRLTNSELSDDLRLQEESQVMKASQYIYSNVIYDVANFLDMNEGIILDYEGFRDAVHENGMNIRSIGRLVEIVKTPLIRRYLLVEMICRSCKQIYREYIRQIVECFTEKVAAKKLPTENVGEKQVGVDKIFDHLIRSSIVDFFHFVLRHSEEQKFFWTNKIVPLLEEKFQFKISLPEHTLPSQLPKDKVYPHKDESDPKQENILLEVQPIQPRVTRNILSSIHPHELFHAMQYHLGVAFKDSHFPQLGRQLFDIESTRSLSLLPMFSIEDIVAWYPLSRSNLDPIGSNICTGRLIDEIENAINAGRISEALYLLKSYIGIEQLTSKNKLKLMKHLIYASELCNALGEIDEAEKYCKTLLEDGIKTHGLMYKGYVLMVKLLHKKIQRQRIQTTETASVTDAENSSNAATNILIDSNANVEKLHNEMMEFYRKAVQVVTAHLGDKYQGLLDIHEVMVDIQYEDNKLEQVLQILQIEATLASQYVDDSRETKISNSPVKKKISGSEGFSAALANIRCTQGKILYELGEIDKSIAMYEYAKTIYLHLAKQEKEAVDFALKANATEEKTHNQNIGMDANLYEQFALYSSLASNCSVTIAEILAEQQQPAKAYDYALEAYNLRLQMGTEDNIELKNSLIQMASLCEEVKDYRKSIDYYCKALEISKKSTPSDIHEIQDLIESVIRVYFRSLSTEENEVKLKVEKTLSKSISQDDITYVMSQLYQRDILTYLTSIFHHITENKPPRVDTIISEKIPLPKVQFHALLYLLNPDTYELL